MLQATRALDTKNDKRIKHNIPISVLTSHYTTNRIEYHGINLELGWFWNFIEILTPKQKFICLRKKKNMHHKSFSKLFLIAITEFQTDESMIDMNTQFRYISPLQGIVIYWTQ